MYIYILTEHFSVAAMSVVQLGTVTRCLDQDIVLYGNFLWIFKNPFFKEALKSYLGRELAKIQLLCADWRKHAGEARVCTGSSQRQGQVFSFPAGQGGPCCSLPISLELWSFSETRFPSPEGAAMNLWVFAVGWKLPPLCHHPSCAQHPWLWAWSSSISSNTWVSTEGEDFAFFPWQDHGSLKNTLLLKYKTIYDCL